MAINVNAAVVLADGETILKVWTDNPDFKMGEVTLAKFKTAVEGLDKTITDMGDKELELKALANTRDDSAKELCEWNTRARSGIRSVFGPDSTEYEQAGGTRKSERKKPSRKAKATEKKAA